MPKGKRKTYQKGSFVGNLAEMSDMDKSEAMADVMKAIFDKIVKPAVIAEKINAVLSQTQVCERVLKSLGTSANPWPELTALFLTTTEQDDFLLFAHEKEYKSGQAFRLEFAKHVFPESWYEIHA